MFSLSSLWGGNSGKKENGPMSQRYSVSDLRSLRDATWVDCRYRKNGSFYPAWIQRSRKRSNSPEWFVELTNYNRTQTLIKVFISEQNLIAYKFNSMVFESKHLRYRDSIFGNLQIGIKVEINKFGAVPQNWQLAEVINITVPLIHVRMCDSSTWCTHYLLTNEIRLFNNNNFNYCNNGNNYNIFDSNINGVSNNGINNNFSSSRGNNNSNGKISNKNRNNSNKMDNGIDTVANISELIRNRNDSDGSLDVILDECSKQFNFESKSDFIAHLFDLSKDKLPPKQCNRLLTSLNDILNVSDSNDTDCNVNEDIEMRNCGCAHSTRTNTNRTPANSKVTRKTRNTTKNTGHTHVHESTYFPKDEKQHKHGTQARRNCKKQDKQDKQEKQKRVGSSRAHVQASHSQQTHHTGRRGHTTTTAKRTTTTHTGRGRSGWQNKTQTQSQISKDVETQQEQVASVQLLINSTKSVLMVLNEYCERMIELKMYEKRMNSINYDYNNDKEWNQLKQFSQNCNIKAVTGLQLFEMQFEGFKEKCSKRGMSDSIGSKNARKVIEEFLAKMQDKLLSNNGNNGNDNYNFNDLESGFILDRIDPFTNAMKSVLHGSKLPEFQQLTNVNFDSKTVNNVLSKVMQRSNHSIPETVNKVKQNYKEFDMQQRMNVMDMSDANDKDISIDKYGNKYGKTFDEKDANSLYRDIYSHKMKKQTTLGEMERRAERDLEKHKKEYVHARPDLLGVEPDEESSGESESNCDSF